MVLKAVKIILNKINKINVPGESEGFMGNRFLMEQIRWMPLCIDLSYLVTFTNLLLVYLFIYLFIHLYVDLYYFLPSTVFQPPSPVRTLQTLMFGNKQIECLGCNRETASSLVLKTVENETFP